MSSIFTNPSFYVAIFSSVGFVASEILPFVPNTGNGVVHAILVCLSNYSGGNKETTSAETLSVLSSKIDTIYNYISSTQVKDDYEDHIV